MIINVVHAVPESASAFGRDHDGFTAALEVVGRDHDVRWLNVHPYNDDHRARARQIPDADFVLVRSDWGWLPCAAADRALFGRTDVPSGLLIAGSSPAPPPARQRRFDTVFFETPWYAPFVAEHPFAHLAFGVDSRAMRNHHREHRSWDWLMVGRLAAFKRPEQLAARAGRRLAIGDLSSADPAVVATLRDSGVELRDFVAYDELAELYNDSRRVLVPCTLQGGGERAVVEAMTCGCDVEIAPDNPKLASLLGRPVADHEAYGSILQWAIEEVVGGRRIDDAVKLEAQRLARWDVWSDKARRLPRTLGIRARGIIPSRSARR